MIAKREVLTYVAECEPATSAEVASALDYATQTGAAATLLRLHRQGHLRREHDGVRYFYFIRNKGRAWLDFFG